MPVMDEFREEREALKHGTPKQKLAYFLDYYKWQTIAAVVAIIVLVSFIYEQVTKKEDLLYATFLNCVSAQDASSVLSEDFLGRLGADPAKSQISIDNTLTITDNALDETTYASIQKMTVYIAAKELDLIACDEEVLNRYAYDEILFDLRDVLSPEQIKAYEPYFYYVDWAIVEKQAEAYDNLEEYIPHYPDASKPEEMEDPVPVALFLGDNAKLKDLYEFVGDSPAIGIVVNTPRPEAATAFIDFLFEEEP